MEDPIYPEPTRTEIGYWLDLFGDPHLSPKDAERGRNQILGYLDKLEVELQKAKGQQPLSFE